ncbi:hypothetical protein M422DRAFT_273916 [Sphaerobolus stellatus SS14]|uniref:MULE transposase domain-containing protein n=1 Tax=Sphaerobolus stellatus (strain SS14) TaxID=990650 RepID=A0A0C9UIR7_SPHS4|nr:hypothetical protein M422DRAFT_273916 [Sphaerobolus stellatus SS14]
MALPSLKLAIRHILTPQTYPTNPRKLTFEDPDEWESWLASECAVYTNWRFKKDIPQAQSNRKRKFEWKRLYECDHAGSPRDRRDENLSPKKRRKTGPSIKVRCNAKIEVYQLVGSNVVTVDHYWQHNNHDPATLVNMKMSRNPDAVRHWLDARVHEGFDSKVIKAMIRMTSEELAEITKEVDSLPYSIKISAQDIYNATKRKAMATTYLSPDPDESIRLWMDALRKKGWTVAYEPTPGEESRQGFTIQLCSKWQKSLIPHYGETVCLDSTHNTCKGPLREKMFLSTILARDRVTGKGVPLAWMITNLESHYPLVQFLKWLRTECSFSPRTIMIDCSDTEALAIKLAFSDLIISILFCYWHLWEAWDVGLWYTVDRYMRGIVDRIQ